MKFYKGKTVWIIGGTSGIGRSTALEIASQGASVIVIGKPDHSFEIFDDPIKAKEMGQRGRQWIDSHWRWDIWSTKFSELLKIN